MKGYKMRTRRHGVPRRLIGVLFVLIVIAVASIFVVRHFYDQNLQPADPNGKTQYVTIDSGSTASRIANQLKKAGIIRDSHTFELYVAVHDDREKLQAGTYKLSPSQSVPQIVDALVGGKVASDLVTIIPGERIDQVRQSFIKAGFDSTAVDAALQLQQYRGTYPALADIPVSATTLEGFLYPDSYEKTATTAPKQIVEEALTEMQQHLTPALRKSFAQEGLTTYQGVTLASIVEEEVSKSTDRTQVAQVFLKRLHSGISLGSDVTAFYGAIRAAQTPSVNYDSPYNTLLHKGLPPGPISAVSDQSLEAVAHPANTDWLFFVTGDDGVTHFSKTLQQHEAYTQQYCHKLCQSQ